MRRTGILQSFWAIKRDRTEKLPRNVSEKQRMWSWVLQRVQLFYYILLLLSLLFCSREIFSNLRNRFWGQLCVHTTPLEFHWSYSWAAEGKTWPLVDNFCSQFVVSIYPHKNASIQK